MRLPLRRPAAATPGLGTGIVDALARHLGAVVERSDNDPGTRVAIVRAA
jgi:two-component sensor histidine kinase